jgi:hypothetical protein
MNPVAIAALTGHEVRTLQGATTRDISKNN